MSYCSANFEFNPQVQSVLLWATANADCLSACGGPESCHDGIQNGDETEVDCGGTLCDPCPTCSDNVQNGKETEVDCGGPFCPPCPCIGGENISISITLNTFVSTTWGIADANNIIVAQGGTYGVPGGSTVTEVVCLDYGCYDFTIYNSFGIGSYSVTDENNTVLASGVNLNETTNFCLIQPTCSITSSLSKTDETVQGANDGTITVTASCTGTCGTLQYALNGGTPQTSNVFTGLAPGMYAVETSNVGDATCNDFREITINEGTAPPAGDVYVLVATDDDLEFDECVAHSGGIGIMSAGDEAEIEDNAVVTAPGTFVKAPEIDVDNSSVVTVQIEEQADPVLPVFRYNNTNPGYDLEINVDDGETVILMESLYEDIKVGDDATIIFSGQSDVYIEDLETEDDVTILFDQCTNLMLSGDLELGKDNNFNASGTMDVIVFAEKKIKIKKRADVYGILFALKKFETKKSSSSQTSKFHGLFIGKEIEANEHGEYWAQNFNPECAPPPLQPNGPGTAMQENPNPAKEKKSVQHVGSFNKVDFSLYPNPANDQVHILVKSEIEKAAIIRIFNMQGKLMASREFEILDDGRITFDLNQFAPGMYTVMISIDGNIPATKKLVVQ
jgi:hypothetical protein